MVFAPAICGPRPLSCWDVIDEHIRLFKSARIDGILYSHPENLYPRPGEHKFANEVQGLRLRTGFCKDLTGMRTHGFYRRSCSKSISKEVKRFIYKRTIGTKSRQVLSHEKNSIEALERKVKYLKARKVVLDQIKELETKLKLFQTKLKILKLEFETGK